MSTLAQLIVKIGADVSGLTKGLDTAQQKMAVTGENIEAMGNKVSKAGRTLSAAVTLPIVGAAAASFKLASDYQESINKVDVAFKDSAQGVKDWSKDTLTQFGLAQGTALDMAAAYGDMATSMGLSTGEASNMSTSLVGLAGDLASFKNIGIDEANTALTAIFTGETESLKRLGVVMTQANLDEYALSQGIKKKTKDMTQAEQVQLRYNYVMSKTTNAQGDFARTQGGAANQMRIFGESLKELGVSFGENLLPVITPIIQKINETVKAFGLLSPESKKTITVFALILAAAGPLLVGLGFLASSVTAVSAALPVLGAVFTLLTGPIGWVVASVVVVMAIFKRLWDTSPNFRAWARDLGVDLSNFLIDKINLVIDVLNGLIWALNKVTNWEVPKIGKIANIVTSEETANDIGNQAYWRNMEREGHNASGTNFWKGGMTWVGEQGPELVNLPRGAKVLSNIKSMAYANDQQTIHHDGTVYHVFETNDRGMVARVAQEFNRDNRRIPARIATMPSKA